MKLVIIFASLLWGCGDEPSETTNSVAITTEPVPTNPTPEVKPEKPIESSGATECDTRLKEYEAFVDEYVAVMKKVQNGEEISDAQDKVLQEKAEKAGENIGNWLTTNNMLNTDCWKRYNEISMKITTAAMETMQKIAPEGNPAMQQAMDMTKCMQACQANSDPQKMGECMQACQ